MAEKEDLKPEDFTIQKKQLLIDCVKSKKTQHGDRWVILNRLANKTDGIYIPKSRPYVSGLLKDALRNVYDYEVDLRRLKDGSIATFENDRKGECFDLFKEITEKEDLKPEDFTMEKKQLIVDCVKSKETQYGDCWVILDRLANKTDDMYIPKSEPLDKDDVGELLKDALRNVYDYEVEVRRLKDGKFATFDNDRKGECIKVFKEMAEKEDLKPEDFTMGKRQLIVDCVKTKSISA